VRFRRHLVSRPRSWSLAVALLLGALLALVAPAFASAETFVVSSELDTAGAAGCESHPEGVCTLRGAIVAANTVAGPDAINFDGSLFDGEAGDAVTLTGPLPELKGPATISGGTCGAELTPCATVIGVSGFASFTLAGETVLQNLSIEGGGLGVRVIGTGGAQVLDDVITGSAGGVEIIGSAGGVGNLIKGNAIRPSGAFSRAIALRTGPNQIVGNEISGCNFASIVLEDAADGNKIGGDTPESENVIESSLENPIALFALPESSHNEIARNRGTNNNASFIFLQGSANGGIQAPVIASALQSSVSGTGKPGALVRLFQVQLEFNGEIESFLGEATVEPTGDWKVTLPKSAVGTSVSATQTLNAGTSVMSEVANLVEDPSGGGGENGGGSGGGGSGENSGSGGGGSTGGGTSQPGPSAPAPTIAPSPPTAPVVKITKGPARSSRSTTARFRFIATPAAGATFECKLDAAKWTKCRSPRTYKRLEPGRHTFQVRASPASKPTKFQFTIKP
jgi:uncharacterized membrane protein YgcG